MYYSVKDKVTFDGTEYSFDSINGNKILLKLKTNGSLSYYKIVDKGMASFSLIDLSGEDKINASGYTAENLISTLQPSET